MSGRDGIADVAIIGAGRMGQGLALALTRRGRKATLLGRDWEPSAVRQACLVLVAVPDEAIEAVASSLAARQAVSETHVVLHLSGLLDHNALKPLEPSGTALGSFHPLQSISDPTSASEQLKGVYAGVEGDERAIQAAEALAETLGMTAVRIPAHAKPAYHAGAVIVSNYTVALLGVAQRLAAAAGIPNEIASKLYLPLLQGTVANLTASGPAGALTGPVRRGDVHTIRTHLDALKPKDRELYRQLGLAALELAVQTKLDPVSIAQIEKLFAG